MDKKISQLPVVTDLDPADLIPIVSGGENKVITGATLAEAVGGSGSSGTYIHNITSVEGSVIPVAYTMAIIGTGAFTLEDGDPGQEMVIYSVGASTVPIIGGTATFLAGGVLTVISLDELGWVCKSAYRVTVA